MRDMISDPHTLIRAVMISTMVGGVVVLVGFGIVKWLHKIWKWYYDWEDLT
jgi:hypothetical protein